MKWTKNNHSTTVLTLFCLSMLTMTLACEEADTVFEDANDQSFEVLASGKRCVSSNERGSVKLDCGSSKINSIRFASYGTPTGSCNSGYRTSSCHASSSKSRVEDACLGRSSCSVRARNDAFGDPCKGTYKRLSVQYSCDANDSGGDGDDCDDEECSSDCPCSEGEGDCDKDSHCKSGLVCKQRSGTDYCVKPDDDDDDDDDGGSGSVNSNLQVKINGAWKGVCCVGGDLEISNSSCKWTEGGRVMKTKDTRKGSSTALDCPEGGAKDCDCSSSGERMHGIKANGNVSVENSLKLSGGAPIYPNSGHEYCVDLVNGELRSRKTSSSCPNWRMTNFY